MFVDFDTTEPFEGIHGAQHKVDINKFGKSVDKEVHKFEINNTMAANKVKFKIFRQGSRQSERLRKLGIGLGAQGSAEVAVDDAEEVGLIAMADFDICDLNGFKVNEPIGLCIPVRQIRNSDP